MEVVADSGAGRDDAAVQEDEVGGYVGGVFEEGAVVHAVGSAVGGGGNVELGGIGVGDAFSEGEGCGSHDGEVIFSGPGSLI